LTDPQVTFVVSYPCEKFCIVEIELDAANKQFTQNQMRKLADTRHDTAHRKVYEPVPGHDRLAATFSSPRETQ
jgi:hypothetical protein